MYSKYREQDWKNTFSSDRVPDHRGFGLERFHYLSLRPLVLAMAKAIATEARAFANQGQAGLTIFAPSMNIYRDPRFGRGHETPGEGW